MSEDGSTWHGNFFALDRHQWSRALEFGMTAAACYLVIAQGAHAGGEKSSWSARSIANRTGIGWRSAKTAIGQLLRADLLRQTSDDPLKPRYLITTPDLLPATASNVVYFNGSRMVPSQKRGRAELIWLPCQIVDDDDEKSSILEKIRQTENTDLLRLFIELYYFNDLPSYGGVSPEAVSWRFFRSKLGERGPFTVWGFEPTGYEARSDVLVKPFMTGEVVGPPDPANPFRNDRGWKRFCDALNLLYRLGLLLWVPHVHHTDGDVTPLHPFGAYGGQPGEKTVALEGRRAAVVLLNARGRARAEKIGPVILPLPHHIGAPVVRGILRLRHLPHTTMTADWLDQRFGWDAAARAYAETANVHGRVVTNGY